ncbi:MAG: DNA cytosine methyltransferase, partial [Oscillospiraceae bacterium]
GAKTGLYKIDLPDGDYIIRKLTPVEAERLQTLPDNYTEGISNTQRYKCIGNGWTVDVIAHILKGLKE